LMKKGARSARRSAKQPAARSRLNDPPRHGSCPTSVNTVLSVSLKACRHVHKPTGVGAEKLGVFQRQSQVEIALFTQLAK
jgi:hypothetical protein